MKVSFITTVRNEEVTIGAYLESLATQTRLPDEVVIVDGDSTDSTVSEVEKKRDLFPSLQVVSKQCNIATGRNVAVDMASGDVIVMSDAGSVLDQGWVAEIVRPFEADDGEQVKIVAGNWRILDEPGLASVFRWYYLRNRPDFTEGPARPSNPSARSFAIRRETWLRLGGHPEFLYCGEDTLFNWKWNLKGVTFIFADRAICLWRMHRSLRSFGRQVFNYARAGGRLARRGTLEGTPKRLASFGVLCLLLVTSVFSTALSGWIGVVLAAVAAAVSLVGFNVREEIVSARAYGMPWRAVPLAMLVVVYANWRKTLGAVAGLRDRARGTFEADVLTYIGSCREVRLGNEDAASNEDGISLNPDTGRERISLA